MREYSRPPIEKMEDYARLLVAEWGPVELLMAELGRPEVQWDPYQMPPRPTWELTLAASWADDLMRKGRQSLRTLLPGWPNDPSDPYSMTVHILPSDGRDIDDLLFFIEGQTRRHPELVDVDLPSRYFRRAYVIAHRKAGIGGKLIGAAPTGPA